VEEPEPDIDVPTKVDVGVVAVNAEQPEQRS
jgi:hypothetical protein